MVRLIGSFEKLFSIHRIHKIQNQWDKLMPISLQTLQAIRSTILKVSSNQVWIMRPQIVKV